MHNKILYPTLDSERVLKADMLISEYQFEVLWSTQQRKHKTWQDGKLKYNAFNKKVIVYDENGNVVISGWSARIPSDGDDLEIENAFIQVGTIISRQEREHSARKSPIAEKSVKRPLPTSNIPLDDIIARSKAKRPPQAVHTPPSLQFDAQLDADNDSSEDEVTILKVVDVEPPKSGPVFIPDHLPSQGPWTKEAYLLMNWHPPEVKEEPI